MLIEFTEILHDLELKRAAALDDPPSARGSTSRAAIAALDATDVALVLVEEDGGERPFAMPLRGRAGRRRAHDARARRRRGRGRHRRGPRDRAARSPRDVVDAARRRRAAGARRVTVHDLSVAHRGGADRRPATSRSPRRSCCGARCRRPRGAPRRRAAADPPLRRGRGLAHREDRGRDPQGVPVARARSDPAVALAAARQRARACARHGLRADRDRPGPRPGGARARRAHARRRALHRLPRRARAAARPGGRGRDEPAAPAIPVLEPDGRESRGAARTCASGSPSPRSAWTSGSTRGELERELRRAIRPGVARADLQRLVVLNAKALVERDSELLALRRAHPADLHLRGGAGLGHRSRRRRRPARAFTSGRCGAMLAHGVQIKRIDARAARLRPRRGWPPRWTRRADLDFDFLGLQTLYDRYLLVDKTGARPRRIEAPQLFWLRVAMGVCLAEPEGEDREARVARPLRHVQAAAASARRRRRCSTPGPRTRSCPPATSTRSTTR